MYVYFAAVTIELLMLRVWTVIAKCVSMFWYNSVIWLSGVCYNVSISDIVYYNMLCIVDMLHED